jgi:parvulin-like peptidyl-prolyl isomerase
LRNIDSSDPNNQFLASIYEQQLNQAQASLGLLPDETLDALIEDALIQEKAQEAELSVTDQEVVETIEEDLRLAVAPPPQAPITDTQEIETPTPVPQEELDQVYASALENMGLSERQYQEIVKRGMLRDKVQEFLASQVITTGLVVHLQIIETDAEEQATAALERVESGEDFAVVATEVSTDTLSVNDGGDLGWVTTGQLSPRYGQELETEALSAEVGKPAIVQSGDQFYVYLVVERDENGPLPADVLSQRQATAIFDWLEERKASPEVEIERLLDPAAVPADPFEAVSGG